MRWAEELGIAHITTAAVSGSRDANRFMARLALGPHAVLRLRRPPLVRAKLAAQATRRRTAQRPLRRPPAHARPGRAGAPPGGAQRHRIADSQR